MGDLILPRKETMVRCITRQDSMIRRLDGMLDGASEGLTDCICLNWMPGGEWTKPKNQTYFTKESRNRSE